MAYKLCVQYGFDATQRQYRLNQLELTKADQPLMLEIHERIILPRHRQIMDDFYAFILSHAELRKFVKNDEHIVRLKQTQTEYLLSLGVDFMSADYFEYRLRVGVAHARIDMPISSYIIAYSKMHELICAHLHNGHLSTAHFHTLNKILMLDMSLATDAYNLSQFNWMSESIHELQNEQTRLTNQLMHDTLTDAYSRAYILEQLDKRLSELKRDQHKYLAVALLDLDKFKEINDTYGHQAGDYVLHEFAHTAMHMIRREDYFGRYGGEEFLLILVDLDHDSAIELAERIRIALANKVYPLNQKQLQVTTSIGLTVARAGDNRNDIIERADRALYEAKQKGRNQTVVRQ
jgi:diguanylate cyclase (GGDEF)-like protein